MKSRKYFTPQPPPLVHNYKAEREVFAIIKKSTHGMTFSDVREALPDNTVNHTLYLADALAALTKKSAIKRTVAGRYKSVNR